MTLPTPPEEAAPLISADQAPALIGPSGRDVGGYVDEAKAAWLMQALGGPKLTVLASPDHGITVCASGGVS